jgi:ribosomal-protein-alanine N-acetyltransferase
MLHYPATPLSDGTILLRPWTEQDLPALEQASHDPYIPATTSVPSPYTHAEALKWLERQQQRVLENVGLPFCIADAQTDEPMGFIGLWLSTLSQGRASFGYWIIPNARQRGIASAALRLLSRWTFEQLPVARLELWVEPWNTASQRVAERAGFLREGVLHSYIEVEKTRRDVIMYARIAPAIPTQKELVNDANTEQI